MTRTSQPPGGASIRIHPDRDGRHWASREQAERTPLILDYLDSAPDVIAVRVEGRLSRDEIMELVARLERTLEEHDKTHLFVEIADFHGFDWTSLGEYLPHSWRMLVDREKFGRIAVVSDLAWVRWATRVESALIPGLSYETYRMEEREQALAWVEGRSPYPHGEAVTWLETGDPDMFGFELDGRVGAEEMHALAERVNKLLDSRPGPVRILGKFTNFSMPPTGGLDADYMRMKLKALHKVERYAVVGGPLWLAAWVSAVAPLLKCEVRHFPADKEADAWAWLGASPARPGRTLPDPS